MSLPKGIKLQVGEAYRSRYGQKVKIKCVDMMHKRFPYGSLSDHAYSVDGVRYVDANEPNTDLIAPWFEVGDRVVCISDEWAAIDKGGIYIVEEIVDKGLVVLEKSPNYPMQDFDHAPDTKSKGSKDMTDRRELEKLVEAANQGELAAKQIYEKYNAEVEYNYLDDAAGKWESTSRDAPVWKYRIKSYAPVFKPFTIGDDWEVTVEGEQVNISCEGFGLNSLINALSDVIEGAFKSLASFGGTPLMGARKHVHWKGQFLPWPDADKLLKRLEEYKKELNNG